jgi:hypothetical protein
MSDARMLELKKMLENEGWEISAELGFLSAHNDKIYWKLRHPKIGNERELIFYLFDSLGRRTTDLNDILYVIEENKKLKLYFEKISSKKWRVSTKKFVIDLY